MQRLLALGQQPRRPPFPSGFFNSRVPQGNSSGTTRSRYQSFSDSSRSRPKNSAGNGGSARQAKGEQQQASPTAAAKAVTPAETATAKERTGQETPAAVESSIGKQESENDVSGRRIQPLSQVEPPFPRSIIPAPILFTPPQQIQLDSFYSLHRPLLEVTVPLKSRNSASDSDRKAMKIVGELDENSEIEINSLEIGEYDPYLVLEPNGADPDWAEGTDRFLASLDHTIPPPVPLSSEKDGKDSASSISASTSKHSKRQEDIDYLFPFQAAMRSQEEEERSHYAHLPSRTAQLSSISSPSSSSSPTRSFEGNTNTGYGKANNGMPTHSPANQFLTSHLIKNQWKAMWNWERVRKALKAASDRLNKGKGRLLAQTEPAEEGVSKPLESLRQTARARSRARARAKRARRDVTREVVDLQQLFDDATREGHVVVISMPSPDHHGQAGEDSHASAAAKEAFNDEIKRVIKQVRKFSDFFDKSVDFDVPQAVKNRIGEEIREEGTDKNIEIVHVKWNSFQGKQLRKEGNLPTRDQAAPQLVRAESDAGDETGTSKSSMHERDRRSLLGPRTGIMQGSRGLHLRRTLRDRLALRGVNLVGQHRTVSMDSVKRKRRKRISKHKWVHSDSDLLRTQDQANCVALIGTRNEERLLDPSEEKPASNQQCMERRTTYHIYRFCLLSNCLCK